MPTPAHITSDQLPHVLLIGRANVGKSSLFNKLTEENKALVSTIAGTTRTNNEGDIIWRGKEIHLIDTGGQDTEENELFAKEIVDQAEDALERADIIVMVVDAKVGILPQERELARKLQKIAKKTTADIIFIANKVDNSKIENKLDDPEWLKLALGRPLPVSAASGRGVGDFLDEVYKLANKRSVRPKKVRQKNEETISVSLVGKPNVGKSSMFNKLIGQDKVIVSDVAHTTREPFDTTVTYESALGTKKKKHTITFVDTAGVRRKARVSGFLEREGIKKTVGAIEKSDIVLLVIDGSEPISSQDLQLGGLVKKRSKSVIIVINKWDLSEDNSETQRNHVKKVVRSHFPHLDFAPIIFVSGKTGYRIHDLFPLIIRVMEARKTSIPAATLNKFLETSMRQHKPSRGKGTRQPKILGMKQLNVNPPIFEIKIKYRTSIHRSYISYLENKLREQFDFIGAPIVIKMTKLRKG